jgi:hypothetical protein
MLTSKGIIVSLLVLCCMACSCKPKSKSIIDDFQSDDPQRIISAYNYVMDDPENRIPILLDMDVGPFCMYGLHIIKELGTDALQIVKELLANETDVKKREMLICCFGAIGSIDDESIGILNNEFYQGNFQMRQTICRVIESTQPSTAMVEGILIEGLTSQHNFLIEASAYAIAEIARPQDEEFLPPLRTIWENSTITGIKLPVASALYNLGWEKDTMRDFILNNVHDYASTTCRSMSKLEDLDLIAEFRSIIFDERYSRLDAWQVISEIIEYEPLPEIVGLLVESLDLGDIEINTRAISQLSFLGPEASSAEPILVEFMENPQHLNAQDLGKLTEQSLFWIRQDKVYVFRYFGSYFTSFI